MPLFANVIIAVALQTAVVPVQGKGGTKFLSACFEKYPDYDGDIDASDGSKVIIKFNKAGGMNFKFRGKGIEKNIAGGVHIHDGMTCDRHADVGNHYWDNKDGTIVDPWKDVVYNTDSNGMSNDNYKLDSGYDLEINSGHAVVVHDEGGKRIGCGVLSKSKGAAKSCKPKKTVLSACISPFPGYAGDLDLHGKVRAVFKRDKMQFKFKLEGADPNCEGCGIHIHSGTTCDNEAYVGGHYWDDRGGTIGDPWSVSGGTIYNTTSDGDATGSFPVRSGYGAQANIDHAVVVHDSENVRYGCGLLSTAEATGCLS